MISAPDRRRAVELIDEARKSGTRLEPACGELGITARTYHALDQKRPGENRPATRGAAAGSSKQAVAGGARKRFERLP